MSTVEASSLFARTASLCSIMAAASSSSFWFSPLAIFLLCCSPLGVVSLESCGAGSCCRLVILHVFIFTPWLSLHLQLGVSTLQGGGGGGGGLLTLCRRFFVEGFREWSPGLANSLWRDEISGAERQYPLWVSLALSCAVWFSGGSLRLAVGPCCP